MKRFCINVDEKICEYLDKLVELEVFPSRAEAIRSALRDFVQKESQILSNINKDMKKLKVLNRKYFSSEVKDINQLINNEERESFISTPKIKISKNPQGD